VIDGFEMKQSWVDSIPILLTAFVVTVGSTATVVSAAVPVVDIPKLV
jgi:hypothetical protein